MRTFGILFLVLLCSFSSRAAEERKIVEQANEAYAAKKYDKAIQRYQQLLEQSGPSEVVFYNLGNSYYRKGELGKAVLFYEKALLLDPDDEDILHNLKVAKASSKDELEELPEFFLSRWWNNLRLLMSTTAWSILGLILLWLGIGGIILWLMGNSRQQKKQGFIAGISFLVLSVLPFSLVLSGANLERDSGYAVIMSVEIKLRSAPDSESKEILRLHEGTKVAVLDQIGDWHKVKLSNGEQGWLPNTSIEKI